MTFDAVPSVDGLHHAEGRGYKAAGPWGRGYEAAGPWGQGYEAAGPGAGGTRLRGPRAGGASLWRGCPSGRGGLHPDQAATVVDSLVKVINSLYTA